MRAFTALFIAHWREFSRDPMALVWTFVFPIILALFTGVVFHNETLIFHVGVVNEAGEAGEPFIDALDVHNALEVHTGTRGDELDALEDGQRRAVIIIPREIESGAAALEVAYDPGHQNALLALNAVQQVVGGLNAELVELPLTVIPQPTNATEFRQIDYMLPGVLAMGLMQLALFVAAPVLVARRERGVLRRMGITPIRRMTVLASDMLLRLLLGVVQGGLVLMIGVAVYDTSFDMSQLPAAFGLMVLGGAGFLMFGYVLAGIARSEEAIQVLIGLPNVLFILLCGIFFQVDDMPGWAQTAAGALPLTYLGDALRQTMVGALPLYSMTTNVIVLAAWLVICGVLAVRVFKWEPQA